MQDDSKQYFDIKRTPIPAPTSRPVINNEPVQADPMVSSQPPVSITNLTENSKNDTEPDVTLPEVVSTESSTDNVETTETGNGSNEQTDISLPSDLTQSTEPDEVVYGAANSEATEDNITIQDTPVVESNEDSNNDSPTNDNEQSTVDIEELAQSHPAAPIDNPVSTNNEQVASNPTPTISYDPPAPAAANTTNQNVEPVQQNAVNLNANPKLDLATQTQHPQKHKSNLLVMIILGLLVIFVISLAAYLIHKVKTGQ